MITNQHLWEKMLRIEQLVEYLIFLLPTPDTYFKTDSVDEFLELDDVIGDFAISMNMADKVIEAGY